ncbi:flavin reductase [Sphingobium lactosutens]|uniref:flavin reductase family protein n=1 Tax=Sphingobium lactosutens TaxID=522773 RepID=UPI0015B8CA7E|nr:flavin reductase family protein [Sphingobium lactosutens]NWK98602.1 flavin reductase [Sphingobium lactosutens]
MTQLAQIPDATALRLAMRCVAATVAVVTARFGAELSGVTVTSATSVTMEPPTLLVCVNRSTRLNAIVQASRRFEVNYLTARHRDVAAAFGGGTAGDRFAVGQWDRTAPSPALADALARLSCRLDETVECGTHSIFMGRVEAVHLGDGEPLLYCQGDYAWLAA